jgi:integrase
MTWDAFDGSTITVRYQLARRPIETAQATSKGMARAVGPTGEAAGEVDAAYSPRQWVRVPLKAARSVERIALPAFAASALTALKGGATFGLCFVTPAGAPLSEQQALNALYAAEKRLGLPKVGCHGLRHSSLTILADAGVPEDVRMRRAGHSTTSMARRYTSGADVQDRAAADALNTAIGRR